MTSRSKKFFIGLSITLAAIIFIVAVTLFLLLLRQIFPFPGFISKNATPIIQTTNLPPPPPDTHPSPIEVFIQKTIGAEPPPPPTEFTYIEVTDGCGPHFEGACLNVRSGPGAEYPSVAKLRTGIVLKVSERVETASSTWYKIIFDEWLRYPERAVKDWYVAAAYVSVFNDDGEQTSATSPYNITKRIIVDRSDQKLYAYDGDTLFMETAISTGIELSPTPRGTFTIFRKTPTRYMQGPLPYLTVSKYYDLPGVPWNLYFTKEGAVIHGAYWHDSFGRRYSSGCVNMRPSEAHELYAWATVGTTVTVRD